MPPHSYRLSRRKSPLVLLQFTPKSKKITWISGARDRRFSFKFRRRRHSEKAIIKQFLDQLIRSYNSTHSPLSFRIAAAIPRKKTARRATHRVAPTTVFRQIAQRVRQYPFRSNSSSTTPASVHQPDCGLAPSTTQQQNHARAQMK